MGSLLVTEAIQQHTAADRAGKGKQRKDVRVTGLFAQRSKELMAHNLTCSSERAVPDAGQQPLISESERQESYAADYCMYIYGKSAGETGQEAYGNYAGETGQEAYGNYAGETGQEAYGNHADKTGQEAYRNYARETGQEAYRNHAGETGQDVFKNHALETGKDAYTISASETGPDTQGNCIIEAGTESQDTDTARPAPVTDDMAVNGAVQGEQQAADTNEYGPGENSNDLRNQEREMRERRRLRRQQKKEMLERIRERRRARKEMLENMLERRKERKILLERTFASRKYRAELIVKAHKGKEQQEQLSDIAQTNQQEQRALTGEMLEEQEAAVRLPILGQPDLDALISHLRKKLSQCEGGLKKGYFKASDVKKLRTMLSEAETRRKKYLSMESYEMEQSRRNAALNTIDFHA